MPHVSSSNRECSRSYRLEPRPVGSGSESTSSGCSGLAGSSTGTGTLRLGRAGGSRFWPLPLGKVLVDSNRLLAVPSCSGALAGVRNVCVFCPLKKPRGAAVGNKLELTFCLPFGQPSPCALYQMVSSLSFTRSCFADLRFSNPHEVSQAVLPVQSVVAREN